MSGGWALVRDCPKCRKDERACRCGKEPARPASGGKPTVRLRMEKRRGKPVTVLALEGIEPTAAEALVKELKGKFGTGGTLKEKEIELQGEHREALRPLLAARGFAVKG